MRYIIILSIMFLGLQNIHSESRDLQPFGTDRAIVINENTILYEEPNIDSESITSLFFLQSVQIITKTNINYSGTNQLWYYVDSGIIPQDAKTIETERGWEYSTLKGWISREDLAGRGDFKPVKKIKEMFIISYSICEGHPVYYHIFSNGTYKITTKEEVYHRKKNFLKGRVLRYKNVLMMGEIGDLFYYDDEGKLNDGISWEIIVLTDKSQFPLWARYGMDEIPKGYYIITGDNVNVREEPYIEWEIMTRLRKGQKIPYTVDFSDATHTVKGKKGYWAEIEIPTLPLRESGRPQRGWILDIYLDVEGPFYITTQETELWSSLIIHIEEDFDEELKRSLEEQNKHRKVIMRLKKGDKVIPLKWNFVKEKGGGRWWVYVDTKKRDKNGKRIRGYMLDRYLKPYSQKR